MARKTPPVQDRVLLIIALVCAIVCSAMIAWTINAITHKSWMGMTFSAASTLGLICLSQLAQTRPTDPMSLDER